ncbi:Ww domain-containing protein, partial [Thalictrum thalictroides]
MGRRKERRAAASMGAGRRVKLDLFAEPSTSVEEEEEEEDLNDNNNNNKNKVEEEEEGEKIERPSSSSGKRQDNPLLLLGQYSDEEVNEDLIPVSVHSSSVDLDAK